MAVSRREHHSANECRDRGTRSFVPIVAPARADKARLLGVARHRNGSGYADDVLIVFGYLRAKRGAPVYKTANMAITSAGAISQATRLT